MKAMNSDLTSLNLLFNKQFVHCSFYTAYKTWQIWIKKFDLILDCDNQVMET